MFCLFVVKILLETEQIQCSNFFENKEILLPSNNYHIHWEFAGSFHKCGSSLFGDIMNCYNDVIESCFIPSQKFPPKNIRHFKSRIEYTNHAEKNFDTWFQTYEDHHQSSSGAAAAGIILVRHPYEVIMSGVRYHQVTNEEWTQNSCLSFNYDKCLKNDTYQSYISRVPLDEKINFEMMIIGKMTNDGQYKVAKMENVYKIHLEDMKNPSVMDEKIDNIFKNIDGDANVFRQCVKKFQKHLNNPTSKKKIS